MTKTKKEEVSGGLGIFSLFWVLILGSLKLFFGYNISWLVVLLPFWIGPVVLLLCLSIILSFVVLMVIISIIMDFFNR